MDDAIASRDPPRWEDAPWRGDGRGRGQIERFRVLGEDGIQQNLVLGLLGEQQQLRNGRDGS